MIDSAHSFDISILTVFPVLYEPFLRSSLIDRAQKRQLITCDVVSLLSVVEAKERIDAPVYGYGSGMLLKPLVVQRAIESQEKLHGASYKIFFSPQGKKMTQPALRNILQNLKDKTHIMLLPARYEGMDARVEQHYADAIFSVGDFVLMGGDLPAMMFLEAFCRLIPGVVGKEESVKEESFSGPFLDYSSFTEPVDWQGYKVPDVLRSGNHGAVEAWRKKEAVLKTVYTHFRWLRTQHLSETDKDMICDVIPPHYVALMHTDVLIGNEHKVGTTSVTSLDIHDIARSACTYNLAHYFIVTPLEDQQKVVQRILDFWHEGPGIPYNPNRAQAVRNVSILASLQEVCTTIEKREGKPPVIVATSALRHPHDHILSFNDQTEVWQHKRPVLFVLGTGRGLAPVLLASADYLLQPVEGFSRFNHLSVRTAAGIIFDRWLGLQPSL